MNANEQALRARITLEELDLLVEIARVYGHLGDHRETCALVCWVHHLVGAKEPTDRQMTPYPE